MMECENEAHFKKQQQAHLKKQQRAHLKKQQQAHLKKQQQAQPPATVPERKKMIAQKKPTSIHVAAKAGDLRTVQARLQENAALINMRTSIMTETPLHKAAANNHVEVMRFLLEWKGEEKPELETENIYGETALHLAAENGCTEAVKLLLQHNAFKEAKANSGMTPLHSAVWFSMRTGTVAVVEALLEADADACAKDNEEKTPLCNLPRTLSNEKLRNLLQTYVDRQQASKSQKMIAKLEAALKPIVGLEGLKTQLRRWAKGTVMNEKRRALGLDVPASRPPHMAFLGSPGTGKTMIARLLAELLHMVGVLKENKVVEVQRTDLVGEYIGHTGPRTRIKIKEAEGGILFVDEAYRLMPAESGTDKDLGIEALEEIMSFMDAGKVVVIFAGYPKPMQRVLGANEGFCRRVNRFFHFDDFSCSEIAQIVHSKLAEQKAGSLILGFKLAPDCTVRAIAELLERETTEKQRHLLNGGLVWPLLVNARENLDERLDLDCDSPDELVTITMEDLRCGCHLLPLS